MRGVEKDTAWNSSVSVGIGYIAIPFGVDRDTFVKGCYRRERVSIVLEHGSTMVRNCYIDTNVLQQVKFPSSCEELGSPVVFVMDKFNRLPVVVASFTRSRERVISEEESFTIERQINGGNLSIVGTGDGKLLISLDSKTGSRVKIRVKGENSSVDLKCDGKTEVYSKDEVIISSSNKTSQNLLNQVGDVQGSLTLDSSGLKYSDDKGNEIFVDYVNSRVVHHKGSQPVPLGTTLKSELEKLNSKLETLINSLSNTPPVPGDGGSAIQTAVKLALLATEDVDFSDINSEKSYID